MRLHYLFLFGIFPSFALGHAGEIHDLKIGCPSSIFAGPVFNDAFYYADFGSRKITFYNISRKEKVHNWQLEERDYILQLFYFYYFLALLLETKDTFTIPRFVSLL